MRLFSGRALRAIAGTGTTTLLDAARIELATDNGVLDADVFYAAAAEEYDRVLLQIVAFARDVGGHFHAVREPYAGDLADSGVRLSRSLRGHLGAHTALERRGIEGRTIFERIETACQSRHGRLQRPRLAPFL